LKAKGAGQRAKGEGRRAGAASRRSPPGRGLGWVKKQGRGRRARYE